MHKAKFRYERGSLAFTANAEETAAKTLADISIGMVKGASMRIGSAEEGNTEESTGLRFTMQVSKADYEALDKTQYENIEWGMLIAPVESVAADNNHLRHKNKLPEGKTGGKYETLHHTTPRRNRFQ